MPGIEVMPSGQILYQGSSINKLNIEGLNLMGDQYNQATQNMPAEAVSTIQVMENNQPVRSLEGKVHSNHATLNIKLKRITRCVLLVMQKWELEARLQYGTAV